MARTERLSVRLEPDEKKRIQALAGKSSRKDSDWARLVLLAACGPRDQWFTDQDDQVSDEDQDGSPAPSVCAAPMCGHPQAAHQWDGGVASHICILCPTGENLAWRHSFADANESGKPTDAMSANEVAAALANFIRENRDGFQPGDAIPDLVELSNIFSVRQETVLSALGDVAMAGLIEVGNGGRATVASS
ncbi:hypothetical protein ABT282_07865 [Streptomyces sp. NPDC000927]|uniref:hypothetical protein n=1 Tax=Streptomyces sp. NPDC000927 TaxID=3154371 RepID=UPI00331C64D7